MRCPYCHESCRPVGAVVCQECLGRHHTGCWEEHGACAACGSTRRLVPEATQLVRAGLGEQELAELLRQGRKAEVQSYLEGCQSHAEELRERAEDVEAQLAFEELAARLGRLRSFRVVGSRPEAEELVPLQTVLEGATVGLLLLALATGVRTEWASSFGLCLWLVGVVLGVIAFRKRGGGAAERRSGP